jgi:hypothetical protein
MRRLQIVSQNLNVPVPGTEKKVFTVLEQIGAHEAKGQRSHTYIVQINRCTSHDLAFIFIMFHQVPYRNLPTAQRRKNYLRLSHEKKQNIVVI